MHSLRYSLLGLILASNVTMVNLTMAEDKQITDKQSLEEIVANENFFSSSFV